MIALIPTHEDHPPKDGVIESIKKQNCPYEIVDCTFNNGKNKWTNIINAKEKIRLRAIELGNDFTIFHDYDLINLYNDNYLAMQTALSTNKGLGAVSLSRNEISSNNYNLIYVPNKHICNGVIMVKKEVLNILRFNKYSNIPTCHSTGMSLLNAHFIYRYVDGKKRIEHKE